MHGHAPRVRRRVNQQEGKESKTVVSIDKGEVMNTVVSSAIGAVVGTAITRTVFEK